MLVGGFRNVSDVSRKFRESFAKVSRKFRESSAKDPRKIRESPRESAGFDCKGRYFLSAALVRVLAGTEKLQLQAGAAWLSCWNCGSAFRLLVLKSCDFPAGAAEVHVMCYPCDE